jgi:phosphotransferase system HPr (HPr) family protein
MNALNLQAAEGTLSAPPKVVRTQSHGERSNASTGPACLVVTRAFVYTNVRGMHARPAALLVKSLADFKCNILAQCNGEQANAKSILGLLCLAVGCQSKLTFTATGPDAPEAMLAVERLFQQQFEEAY